jgi:hypothetical protein
MFLTYFLVLLVFLMYLFDTLVKVFVAIFLFFDKIHVFLVIPHFHHFKYCLIEFCCWWSLSSNQNVSSIWIFTNDVFIWEYLLDW